MPLIQKSMKQFFEPKSVALVGASRSPGKLGYELLKNLVESTNSPKIFPINPAGGKILNTPVLDSISALKNAVDLMLIAIPAVAVVEAVQQAAEKGCKNFIIFSAGFGEIGGDGSLREKELSGLITKFDLKVIGPNCLGVVNGNSGFNASFADTPPGGNVAVISQSGAIGSATIDWSRHAGVGFSKFVSLGNKTDITENDLLEYLADDPTTDVILMYLEMFSDGHKFRELVTKISKKKPVVVLKSGTSEAGTAAIASHTGSLAGSDTGADAALRQSGAIRAHSVEEFFQLARTLSWQPIPEGNRVAVITNAGGPGVIATDEVEHFPSLKMAELAPATHEKLKTSLPTTANTHNPVDVIGDALSDRYAAAFDAIGEDPGVDVVLAVLTPQSMTQPEETATALAAMQKKYPEKLVLASWMGGDRVQNGIKKLHDSHIPTFDCPVLALGVAQHITAVAEWRGEQKNYSKEKTLLVPVALRDELHEEIATHPAQLSPSLTFRLLDAIGCPLPSWEIADSETSAVAAVEKIGYPAVIKTAAPSVVHKSDVGGIELNIKSAADAKKSYKNITQKIKKVAPGEEHLVFIQKMESFAHEVIIGIKRDPVFGPMVMFGMGGVYVEVLRDVAWNLAPLDIAEAKKMIHSVRSSKILEGVRGEPGCDLDELAKLIVKIGDLADAVPEIRELDLNPVGISPDSQYVLDARILV